MYLIYDLGAFLAMKAWVLSRGVPRLRLKRPVPVEIELRAFRDSELTDRQRSFFAPFDQKLESLGFRPFCTYTATNTGGKGLSRNYFNPLDPANCNVLVVEVETVVEGKKHFGQASSVNFVTRFADRQRCATSNSGQMKLFDLPPGWKAQRCGNVTDLTELKRRHDRLASGMGVPSLAIADEAAMLENARDYHRVYFGHQVSAGLYAVEPGGTTLRPTERLHWRAIRRHYNPFLHPFRVDSFLPAALLGAGLPLAASRGAEQFTSMLASQAGIPAEPLASHATGHDRRRSGWNRCWMVPKAADHSLDVPVHLCSAVPFGAHTAGADVCLYCLHTRVLRSPIPREAAIDAHRRYQLRGYGVRSIRHLVLCGGVYLHR